MSFSAQQWFRRAFAEKGGEFDYGVVPGDLRFLFEDPVKFSSAGLSEALTSSRGAYPYHVGYVADASFNAAASDTAFGGLVGINFWIPVQLLDACLKYAALCDPAMAIPDTEHLEKADLSASHNLGLEMDWQDHLYRGIEALLSADEGDRRLKIAFQLHSVGAIFVAMHEAMHLILGHAAWFQRKLSEDAMVEFSSVRSRLPPRDSQAVEYLADINAAAGLVSVVERDLREDETVSQPRVEAMRLLGQAIAIALHLLPPSYRSTDSFGRHRSHPHPYLRMQWVNSLLIRQIGESEAQAAVLEPFAYSTLALDRILDGKDRWLDVNRINCAHPRLISDILIGRIAKHANCLQDVFWNSAPQFSGFTRGWPDCGCSHRD